MICGGLLCGIIFSHEAWFPVFRTFPRAPFLFGLPENVAAPFEWFFSSMLVAALLLTIFLRRKIFLLTAVSALVLLCFFDCLRFQPWTYQYLLIFAVFCLRDWKNADEAADAQTLGLLQILIAGLYVWSGIQKLNYNFSHDILPFIFTPLQNLFPSVQFPFALLGILIPLTETFVGIGLFFRKTRNIAVCAAAAMHVFILSLLIAKNYNSVIWFWNFTLIFADVRLFWRNPFSLRETLFKQKITAAKIIVCAAVLLPALNFYGLWDYFLSGAYYAGNTKVPAIRISDETFEKLPPTAKSSVFQTKTGGEKILPLFEWSLNDTNAPVYLETRVFKQITFEICKLADNKTQVELIVRERPAIFDGSFQISRYNCTEIETK